MAKHQNSSNRIHVFDGLRGVAIMIVLLFYYVRHIFPGGFLIINTFFLMSGFFAFRYFYLADVKNTQVDWRLYIKGHLEKRWLPMLSMLTTCSLIILMIAPEYYFNMRNMAISSLVFVNNLFQILASHSYFVQAANPSPFVHLWYVSLNFQFIVLTPLMIVLFYKWHQSKRIAMNMLSVVAILSMVLLGYWYRGEMSISNVYYNPITRLFAFVLGGILAFALPINLRFPTLSNDHVKRLNYVSLGIVLFMYFMMRFMYGTQPFAYRYGMSLFTLLQLIIIVMSLFEQTWLNKVLTFEPLQALGRRSYMYYLWFYPVHLILSEKLSLISVDVLNILIQLSVLALCAEGSYQLFVKQKWVLPYGQSFNLTLGKKRLHYLWQHKKGLYTIKVLTVFYVMFTVFGGMSVFFAKESRNNDSTVIENLMHQNHKLVDESKIEDKDTVKTINNIDGLTRQELLHANALEVTFVGDSVLLSSIAEVKEVFQKAIFDAEIGRQLYESGPVIEQLAKNKLLGPTVVTMLGSNGTFTTGQLQDYIEGIGYDREIFFVTTNLNRLWAADVNAKLEAASHKYGNVKIIDWYDYANGKLDWYYGDHVHPNHDGARALSILLAKQIYLQR